MPDNISQDSRVVTARKILERAADKPETPTLADQLTYWAGLSGELRAALTMALEAFTLTGADRRLLSDALTDAKDLHLRASMACPDCEAAERAGDPAAACPIHRPGLERTGAYDELAGRLLSLGLLPGAGER